MHPLLRYTNNYIVFDLIESWPDAFLNILKKNQELVKLYFDEEYRVDLLGREDIQIRLFSPPNQYIEPFIEINEMISNILFDQFFIGFHATRLTENEILNVSKIGLQPLTPLLVKEKLEILQQNNYINSKDAELILNNNSSSKSNRINLVWMFHCLSTLKENNGTDNLFKYWGGESIYRHFKNDTKNAFDLTSIGSPCIIICKVSGKEMINYTNISERMIKYWYNLHNSIKENCDFDHHVNHKVKVIKVISEEDSLFKILRN